MSTNDEPLIGESMAWLGIENGAEEILNVPEKLLKIAYFFKENQSSAVLNHYERYYGEEEKKHFMKNIMRLYPLSEHVAFQLLDYYSDDKRKNFDVLEAFHFVDRAFDGKRQAVARAIRANAESSNKFLEKMEQSIQAFEKNLEDIKNDFEELEKKGSEEKKLAAEVKKMEEELGKLQKSYSKEALEEQKRKIEKQIRVLRDNEEVFLKDKKELKKIKNEIKRVSTGEEKYEKAILTIQELVKTLPEGEE